MEIGSIYEISPDAVKGCGSRQDCSLAALDEIKKYNKKYCVYTASGREAIALALRSLKQCRPDLPKKCLLPAYMCDTVFFPFEREGWEIHFYHVNKALEADKAELLAQIDKVKPSLLFIHPYYGVDTWKSMRTLLAELRQQGIYIMEDVTQSYYLQGVGKEADYVVGSLRKWYPVPDGGFVAANERLMEEEIDEAGEYAKTRLRVLMDKWEYLNNEWEPEKRKCIKEAYLKQNRELEEQLDKYAGIRNLSNETTYILKRINEYEAKQNRSRNYKYLCDRLMDKTWFMPILPDLEKGGITAPLYLAIYSDKRNELQSFLTAHDIYAPVLWPIGKENEACLTEDERYIYEHMLALPIDQRYGIREMERIAEVMERKAW